MNNQYNIGSQLPPLTLESIQGEKINLSDFRGRRMILPSRATLRQYDLTGSGLWDDLYYVRGALPLYLQYDRGEELIAAQSVILVGEFGGLTIINLDVGDATVFQLLSANL